MWTDHLSTGAQHPPTCQLADLFCLCLQFKLTSWQLLKGRQLRSLCDKVFPPKFVCETADKCVFVLYFSLRRKVCHTKSLHSLWDTKVSCKFFIMIHISMFLPDAVQETYLMPSLNWFTEVTFFFQNHGDECLLWGYVALFRYMCCYRFISHTIGATINTCLVESSIAVMAVGSCKK